MAMMFNKRNPIEMTIDDLIRELADTRTRCRQLEELIGIGQDDALPSRNAVIARAETDAAIIRVHAQRIADRILDQAERDARAIRNGTPPSGPPVKATPVPTPPVTAWSEQAPRRPTEPSPWPGEPTPSPSEPAPSESMVFPVPESWREHLQPKTPVRLEPVPTQPSQPTHPAAPEPWAGREQVADLWDIAPDELDASIDRFMSATMEHSSRDLLLGR